jgi:hypothetical protein
VAALIAAHAALKRADELSASMALLDARVIALDELADGRAELARVELLARCAGLEL